MINKIIKDRHGYLNGKTRVYLKLNSFFSSLGFKEVHTPTELRIGNYCKEMTLYISPNLPSGTRHTRYLGDITYLKWRDMKGYNINANTHFLGLNGYDDDIEEIKVDGVRIADYFKNRNFVVLYYNILETQTSLGDKNEFMLYLLEEFKKEIERIVLKEIDIADAQKKEVLNNFLENITKNIKDFRAKIRNNDVNILDYRKEELKRMSDNVSLKGQIKSLEGGREALGKNVYNRIDEIKKLPFVTRVQLSSKGIRVDFKHIDLNYGGEKVPLGVCYCYINANSIEIINKDCVEFNGTTYHSPHIENGAVCFGSGKEKAYELLAEMKFKELIYFIYIYLKTYNEGDTYLSLSNWKLAKNEGGEYNGNRNSEDDEDWGDDE